MISKWKLSNFKTVRQDTELSFSPLTIFCGANSSGKSSWIQSILLISQTLSHRISSRSVVLNGSLARLGQFSDLRSFNSERREITVGWECRPRKRTQVGVVIPEVAERALTPRTFDSAFYGILDMNVDSISCEIAFDALQSNSPSEIAQLQPKLTRSKLTIRTLNKQDIESIAWINATRAADLKTKNSAFELLNSDKSESQGVKESLEFDVQIDSKSLEKVREVLSTATVLGTSFHHFLPLRLALQIDSAKEKARILANYLGAEDVRLSRTRFFGTHEIYVPNTILTLLREKLSAHFPLNDVTPEMQVNPENAQNEVTLKDWIEAVRKRSPVERYRIQQVMRSIQGFPELVVEAANLESPNPDLALKTLYVPDELLTASKYLEEVFTEYISYLGPLRDEPKPLYPLTSSPDLTYVGLRGEFTAAVLDLHRSKQVLYIPPENFTGSKINFNVSTVPLLSAVSDWMRYLGVAESVQTFDKGKLGHEIIVQTPGVARAHDLTHAGVGVSQVLPILVSCLLGDFDTTFLFEQPELHLHPAVQSRLADFFLSMTLIGKQCIIETHSEYLINRLRFRIASAPSSELNQTTKIYFVEKPADTSKLREIIVNDFGAITDWPQGFFDQSQDESERIIRAATKKMQDQKIKP